MKILALSTAASVLSSCLTHSKLLLSVDFWLSLRHLLKAHPSLPPLSAHPQATDEDSPPNNFLTYTITSASAFPSYFSIVMVEGYAGTLMPVTGLLSWYWCQFNIYCKSEELRFDIIIYFDFHSWFSNTRPWEKSWILFPKTMHITSVTVSKFYFSRIIPIITHKSGK